MGATWCEIHDVTGKIGVCPHIHTFVSKRSGSEKSHSYSSLQEIEAVTILFSKILLFPETIMAYCSKCAKKRKLPTGNKMLKLKLFMNFRALIYLRKNTNFECAICFYKQIFQINYKAEEIPPLINKTIKVETR